MPKATIIKELDDNIQKYSKEGAISDGDVLRIATRIATKQLTDIDHLNKLAKENKEEFVKRLNDEAKKQKQQEDQRIADMNKTLREFAKSAEEMKLLKDDLQKKASQLDEKVQKLENEKTSKDDKIKELQEKLRNEKNSQIQRENQIREKERDEYIKKFVRKWRLKTIIELVLFIAILISGTFWLLASCDWSLNQALIKYKDLSTNIIVSTSLSIIGLVFSSILLNSLFSKYRDYSNIEAYIRTIKIPEELKEIKLN